MDTLHDCWNRIGTWSVATERCERLTQVGHCGNCEVYHNAGRQLLDRSAPAGYLEEWSSLLANPVTRISSGAAFYLFCKLGGRVIGLRTALLEQVTDAATIRRLPHRRNQQILGVTHIRGDVLPCVSFSALLNQDPKSAPSSLTLYKRFVVCEVDHKRWVLPVEDVLGLQRVERDGIQPVPVMDALSPEHALTAGVFPWRDGVATMLDSDRLAALLKQVDL